jgi:hypothetical protein
MSALDTDIPCQEEESVHPSCISNHKTDKVDEGRAGFPSIKRMLATCEVISSSLNPDSHLRVYPLPGSKEYHRRKFGKGCFSSQLVEKRRKFASSRPREKGKCMKMKDFISITRLNEQLGLI